MLAIAGIAMFFRFRTSLPRFDGSVTVAGLEQPVSIVRDARGIPHIYAESENDAWFALGYVHAQDRLFQMEMQRRVGQGRLAEMIGALGLAADRLFRSLGLYRRAQDDQARERRNRQVERAKVKPRRSEYAERDHGKGCRHHHQICAVHPPRHRSLRGLDGLGVSRAGGANRSRHGVASDSSTTAGDSFD